MLFSIVIFLMVVLIAAFWTYQGFFSSLIMCAECVIAAMLAFALYEPVNALWVDSIGKALGFPLALMLVFIVSLTLMRVATDRLIPHAILMPVAIDRAGGAVCGFFSGMIIIGMAAVAIQMLPIGSGMFGFERYATSKNGIPVRNALGVFRPDEFTCGMAGMLSNDRFGGENRFSATKPDLVDALYSGRAVPQSEEPVFMKSDVLKVEAYWHANEVDFPTHTLEAKEAISRTFETRSAAGANTHYLVCAVRIASDASNSNEEIRFRLPQFRIVGPSPKLEGTAQRPTHVYLASAMTDVYTHRHLGPVLVTQDQRDRLVAFGPDTDFILSEQKTKVVKEGKTYKLDVAFEVPTDFEPWYIEFKRGARVDLSRMKPSKEPPDSASIAQGEGGRSGVASKDTGVKVGPAPGGALQVANAIAERSGATDLIPIPLDKNDPTVAKQITGGKLGGDDCHFWVQPPSYILEPTERVEKFWVPDDKRMVQIGSEHMVQNNMFSRSIGFANRVAAQIVVKDSEGNTYFAVGQYAAAEVEGSWKIELQYYPQAEIPERCLKKPTKITHSVLTKAGPKNCKTGFLFLVPPGVKIVSFSAGSGKVQSLNIEVGS